MTWAVSARAKATYCQRAGKAFSEHMDNARQCAVASICNHDSWVELEWKREVSYNTAMCWVSNRLGTSFGDWQLHPLVLKVPEAEAASKAPRQVVAQLPASADVRAEIPIQAIVSGGAPSASAAPVEPGLLLQPPAAAPAQRAEVAPEAAVSARDQAVPPKRRRRVKGPPSVVAPLRAPLQKAASAEAAGAAEAELGIEAEPLPPEWLVQKILNAHAEADRRGTFSRNTWLRAGGTVIGEGTSAVAYRLERAGSGVVVKAWKSPMWESMLSEVDILTRISHPNVIRILDVDVQSPGAIVLADGGASLGSMIHAHSHLGPLPAWRELLPQLLSGVRYIHSRRIMHADLKPGNIVVREGRLRLADFGLATFLESRPTVTPEKLKAQGVRLCTRPFRAIELFLGDAHYGLAIDLWSVGCTVYEMVAQRQLFADKNDEAAIRSIFGCLGRPAGSDLEYLVGLPRFASCFFGAAEGGCDNLCESLRRASMPPRFVAWHLSLMEYRPDVRATAEAACRALPEAFVPETPMPWDY